MLVSEALKIVLLLARESIDRDPTNKPHKEAFRKACRIVENVVTDHMTESAINNSGR